MNKIERLIIQTKRCIAKEFLGLIGLPRNCNAYEYIDGIWFRGNNPLPSQYDVYHKEQFIFKSCAIENLLPQVNGDEDVYIIGSGPSIKKQSLEKLAQRRTILLNGAITLIDTKGLNPFMVVIIDDRFIKNRCDLIRKLPPHVPLVARFKVIRELLLMIPEFFNGRDTYIVEEWFDILDSNVPKEVLLNAFDKVDTLGVFLHSGTVMSVAIQIAAYLNFKNTYLIGLDIGNANQPRFYENSRNLVRSNLLENYQEQILPFMKLASLYYKTKGNGRKIWNCSPETLLPYDVIGYKSFEEI